MTPTFQIQELDLYRITDLPIIVRCRPIVRILHLRMVEGWPRATVLVRNGVAGEEKRDHHLHLRWADQDVPPGTRYVATAVEPETDQAWHLFWDEVVRYPAKEHDPGRRPTPWGFAPAASNGEVRVVLEQADGWTLETTPEGVALLERMWEAAREAWPLDDPGLDLDPKTFRPNAEIEAILGVPLDEETRIALDANIAWWRKRHRDRGDEADETQPAG